MSVSDGFDIFGDKALAAIHELANKVDIIMAVQDDINAKVDALNAEAARISALVADLHAANEPVDLSGIDAAVAALQAIV